MASQISNGSTTIEQSAEFPRKLRINCHATEREATARVLYHAPRPSERPHHPAFINQSACVSVSVSVSELPHETPEGERWAPASVELVGFMSVEQARALHKALGEALACSEVK